MRKYIFLDIDGVLNPMIPHRRGIGKTAKYEMPSDFEPLREIDPECVSNFNRIIVATDAKIVISSAWRNLIINGHMNLRGFSVLLWSHGVRGEVVGHTRKSREDNEEGREPRWMQIRDWLSFNRSPDLELVRYCILDDDHTAFGGRPGVQANSNGLTLDDANRAIEILNG